MHYYGEPELSVPEMLYDIRLSLPVVVPYLYYRYTLAYYTLAIHHMLYYLVYIVYIVYMIVYMIQ